MGVEIIDQIHDSIRQGDLPEWLITVALSSDRDSSTHIVEQQEISAISDRWYDVGVHHILPRIQPDIKSLAN